MASGVTASPHLNGASSASVEARRWADFYAKLFELRDEVFAGKHPRIKLPDSVLEQVAPRPPQNNPPYSSRPTTNGTPNGTYSALNTPPRFPDNSSLHYQPGPYPREAPNGQRSFAAKSTSSIDPVLLTKSDDLVRAELQLKRQRVERVLKDQSDKKAHFKDVDGESRLDVDGLLADALELVKPVSGLPPATNRNSDGSDSFDENSYYSSQVNSSWSSEDVEASQTIDNGADAGATNLQGRAQVDETAAATSNAPDTSLPTPLDEEPYEPTDDLQLYEPPPAAALVDDDDDEVSDYSPPPADNTFAPPRPAKKNAADIRRERRIASGKEKNRGKNGYGLSRPTSPTSTVPVIRNHIRSPIAPQPARVSPLAYAKVPRMDQPRRNGQQDNGRGLASPRTDDNRRNNNSGPGQGDLASPRNSRRQSPAGPQQNIRNPKKRRRETENGERKGRGGNKRVARSPEPETELELEPYIKEEPMSPPPFAASFSDAHSASRRPLRQLPDDVEIVSARDARPQPVYYREQDQLPRTYRHLDEPTSPTFIRVPSRATHRQVDDQDLRRVASLQYARRPYSPVGPEPLPYSPTDVRHVRAASHAFNDRLAQPPVYRQASVRPPAAAPRYVRDRSRSPIQEYLPRAHTPQAMAPPPRQIVMDQYGNKYYASPVVVDPRESVAPPSRRIEADPYFERAVTREPLMRAPARLPEPYEDEDDHHRMPPPPLRRYVEPEVEMVEPRSYRQRGYSLQPAKAEYLPMREPLQIERRSAAAYEEMGPPPREYVSRSFSVRPEPVRREAPGEYITRHESVQPGHARRVDPPPPQQRYREVSIVQADPYGAPDDRRYAYAVPPPQPQRRYLDEQDRPIEVAHDPYAGEARRVSYRY